MRILPTRSNAAQDLLEELLGVCTVSSSLFEEGPLVERSQRVEFSSIDPAPCGHCPRANGIGLLQIFGLAAFREPRGKIVRVGQEYRFTGLPRLFEIRKINALHLDGAFMLTAKRQSRGERHAVNAPMLGSPAEITRLPSCSMASAGSILIARGADGSLSLALFHRKSDEGITECRGVLHEDAPRFLHHHDLE